MKLRSVLVVGYSAWLLCQGAVFAQTAKDALKIVPKDAVGVVVVNRLSATDLKIKALANRLQAPLPASPLELIKGNIALGGLKGVDEKGSALLAVLSAEDGFAPIAYLPITDYQQFLQPFNPGPAAGGITKVQIGNTELLVGNKGSFAILTESKYEGGLKKALQAKKGLGEAMAPLEKFVTDNDLAGVLTPSGIKLFAAQGLEGVAKVKEQLANNPQPGMQSLGDLFDTFSDWMKAVQSGVTHAGMGIRLDKPGNLELDMRVLFVPDSTIARTADQLKSLEQDPLAALPGGPFVFAFSGAMPESWMQSMLDFNTKMVGMAAVGGAKVDADKLKKLEQAYRQMVKGVSGMAMVIGVSGPQGSLLSNSTGLIKVGDSSAYLENYVKALKTVNDLSKDVNLPFTYKAASKKVGKLPAVEVATEITGDNPQAQAQQKIMEAIFGGGGKVLASMVAVDKQTVLTRYTPLADFKDTLNTYKNQTGGLTSDPQVVKTRAMLPKGSQWVFYFSPKGTIEMVTQALTRLGQAPPQLPEFPSTPPVGGGLRMSASGVEARLVLPASVLDGIGVYIQKIQQLRAAGAN